MTVKKTKKRLVKSKRTKKVCQKGGLKNNKMPGMPSSLLRTPKIYLPATSSFSGFQPENSININLFKQKASQQVNLKKKNPLKPTRTKKRKPITSTLFKSPEPYKRPQSEVENNNFEEEALKAIEFHKNNKVTTGYVSISPRLRNTSTTWEPYTNPHIRLSPENTDGYLEMTQPTNTLPYENSSQFKLTNYQLKKIKNAKYGYINV